MRVSYVCVCVTVETATHTHMARARRSCCRCARAFRGPAHPPWVLHGTRGASARLGADSNFNIPYLYQMTGVRTPHPPLTASTEQS